MFESIVRFIDLLSITFVIGATVWFFFVQSPLLLRRMGREAFVPIQMRLTFVLFRASSIALAITTVAAFVHHRVVDALTISAGVSLLGGLIDTFVVVPRALRAGGQSLRDIAAKDAEASTAGFASEGAGAKTRMLHRAVVLFVLVMLVGALVHAFALVNRS